MKWLLFVTNFRFTAHKQEKRQKETHTTRHFYPLFNTKRDLVHLLTNEEKWLHKFVKKIYT